MRTIFSSSEPGKFEILPPPDGVPLAMAQAWKAYLDGVLNSKITDEDRKGWLRFSAEMGAPMIVVNAAKEEEHG